MPGPLAAVRGLPPVVGLNVKGRQAGQLRDVLIHFLPCGVNQPDVQPFELYQGREHGANLQRVALPKLPQGQVPKALQGSLQSLRDPAVRPLGRQKDR